MLEKTLQRVLQECSFCTSDHEECYWSLPVGLPAPYYWATGHWCSWWWTLGQTVCTQYAVRANVNQRGQPLYNWRYPSSSRVQQISIQVYSKMKPIVSVAAGLQVEKTTVRGTYNQEPGEGLPTVVTVVTATGMPELWKNTWYSSQITRHSSIFTEFSKMRPRTNRPVN